MSKYEVISTSSTSQQQQTPPSVAGKWEAVRAQSASSVFPHFPISKWFYSQNQQHAIRWLVWAEQEAEAEAQADNS